MGIIFDKAGYFMNVFLLTGEELFLFIVLDGTFAGTEIMERITRCSWYNDRRGFSFRWDWFS